jgi:hypothetical protein
MVISVAGSMRSETAISMNPPMARLRHPATKISNADSGAFITHSSRQPIEDAVKIRKWFMGRLSPGSFTDSRL